MTSSTSALVLFEDSKIPMLNEDDHVFLKIDDRSLYFEDSDTPMFDEEYQDYLEARSLYFEDSDTPMFEEDDKDLEDMFIFNEDQSLNTLQYPPMFDEDDQDYLEDKPRHNMIEEDDDDDDDDEEEEEEEEDEISLTQPPLPLKYMCARIINLVTFHESLYTVFIALPLPLCLKHYLWDVQRSEFRLSNKRSLSYVLSSTPSS